MISFDNNKSPGNDGLTKEFYQTFWEDVKYIFFNIMKDVFELKEPHITYGQNQITLHAEMLRLHFMVSYQLST